MGLRRRHESASNPAKDNIYCRTANQRFATDASGKVGRCTSISRRRSLWGHVLKVKERWILLICWTVMSYMGDLLHREAKIRDTELAINKPISMCVCRYDDNIDIYDFQK